MNGYWLVPAVLALGAIVLALLERMTAGSWGVDASRMTPAVEGSGGKHALLLLAGGLLACMGPAMICTAAEPDLPMIGMLLACALQGGLIGYAALFVSIRHEGRSVAGVLEEEIGAAAGKAAHALAAVVMAIAATVVTADWLFRLGSPVRYAQEMPVICAVMLLMALFAYAPGALAARQIRSEADAGALAMGGALVTMLLAVLGSVIRGADMLPALVDCWPAMTVAGEAFTLLALEYMGSRAIGALFARRSFVRKRPSSLKKMLPSLAMLILTALILILPAEIAHRAPAAAEIAAAVPVICTVLCALLTAMTACASALWLGRIERGGRWLYALGALALIFAALILL